jgi:hypothetical protein
LDAPCEHGGQCYERLRDFGVFVLDEQSQENYSPAARGFEDSALVEPGRGGSTFTATVDVVESLSSDVYLGKKIHEAVLR